MREGIACDLDGLREEGQTTPPSHKPTLPTMNFLPNFRVLALEEWKKPQFSIARSERTNFA
jgi:hypothetical protein